MNDAPDILSARIVTHPESGQDCLLAIDDAGRRVAFNFETASDRPGLELVDPNLWFAAASEVSPEQSAERWEVVQDAQADDYLQAVESDPVGAEWLSQIKSAYPDAYRVWHSMTQYDEGGEEGSG